MQKTQQAARLCAVKIHGPITMKNYLLILLMLCGTNSFAALNKWVDANGKVHYSDQPPPANVKTQILRTAPVDSAPSSAAASAPAAPKTIAEREAELKKAQLKKQAAAEKAAQEQEREKVIKENCEASQRSLRTLQNGRRINEVNAAGERAYLTDEQIQQKIEKAERDVKTYCK